jgi:putative hydrolase of the HAD superfamily
MNFPEAINMILNYKYIGFDADDTLWINEPYYRETEAKFFRLMSEYGTEETLNQELYKTEMQNLEWYGYGAKGFMLSLIETALRISNYQVPDKVISSIIQLGKDLLNKPVILLEGVVEILEHLNKNGVKMIVATKGDLLDQERKLKKSNIEKYFHHVEVMSDKKESDYLKLLAHLEIKPDDFLMIGNSLKSDIIPVLNIGGHCIHIPYHTTWHHEEVPHMEEHTNLIKIDQLIEIIEIFGG